MSITVIISVQVTNFHDCKSKFSGIEASPIDAGIKATAYRDLDDSTKLYVIGTAPSKDIFLAFFSSPRRQAIRDSGVITFAPGSLFWKKPSFFREHIALSSIPIMVRLSASIYITGENSWPQKMVN